MVAIDTLLKEGIKELSLTPPLSFLQKINTYIEEIILFNRTHSLINTNLKEEIVKYHILDSLTSASFISNKVKDAPKDKPFLVADVGSGAGLPAIPLALYFMDSPNLSFTLIERSEKRAAFLQNERAILALNNANILNASIEKIKMRFDIITIRALKTMTFPLLKTLLLHLKTGGVLISYKGKKDKTLKELERLNLNPSCINQNPSYIPSALPPYISDKPPYIIEEFNYSFQDGKERSLVFLPQNSYLIK